MDAAPPGQQPRPHSSTLTTPPYLPPGALAAVDETVRNHQQRNGQPGIAYWIVAGGSLVHEGGLGQSWLGGPPPDSGTVFRIASMTKSFTASAVLALRDEGALRLDDPVADYVPELRGMHQVTADSPVITIRHLLTMTAGFPTDDPWGDRQQGTPLAEFAEFLRCGVRQAWAPGTCFEYSNLGYALLGRVIAAAAQTGYREFVTARLLDPLGMRRTGFEAADFDLAELARGYQRRPDGWAELAPDPYGAFAPMGGIFSCVRDLARWASGFAAAFPAGAKAAGGPHPLGRATRREMQLSQVAIPRRGPLRLPGDPASGSQASYGFGLFIEETPTWGRIVQHSGGYPGFGSHMRWHLATGLAVIVLANSTYAAAHSLGAQLMEVLLRATSASPGPANGSAPPLVRGPAPAPGGPWPETRRAQQAVDQLIRSWNDQKAVGIFTENVAQDEPYPQRRAKAEQLWQRLGPPRGEGVRPAESDSPAHCRWWLHGAHGDAAVEIRLTPEAPPRVQSLTLTVPPAPGSPLAEAIQAILSLLNGGSRDWPADLPVSPSVDTGLLMRQLRMASAWAGSCRAGAWSGGNGQITSVVELDGEHARLSLAVELSADTHRLNRVDIGLLS
jgi:CubicO group peptidase (beta-lactamase class C family)